MDAYDPYQYDKLEALLEKGLAPFGITAENIQETQNRVLIMQYPPDEINGIVMDISVDGQYAFSIRRELERVEVALGTMSLVAVYEMFVEGES